MVPMLCATICTRPTGSLAINPSILLTHVYTRLYFADEEAANAADPVLATAPAERRRTLIASCEKTARGVQYRFDIHMQGEDETVFFDL